MLQCMHCLLLRRALRLVEGGGRRARLQQPLDLLQHMGMRVFMPMPMPMPMHMPMTCRMCICGARARARAARRRHLSEALRREGVQGRVASEGFGKV